MATYIVATVRVHDPVRMARYVSEVAGLNERFGGRSLVKGTVTEVLEGDSVVDELVGVARFPTAEDAKAFLQSPEYQAAKLHRLGAADVVIRLVEEMA